MAEFKKYLDLNGLSTFWNKVKTSYIDVNAAAIVAEKERAEAAEKLNADNLAQELLDRAAADSALETAYKAADSALETAYKAADAELKSAYEAADAALESSKASKVELESAVSTLNGEIAKKVDQTAYDSKMSELDGEISGLDQKIEGLTSGAVSEVSAKVDTLIGSDANQSVRAIAQDEIAKQLTSENISESFDTLKEMAEYLSSHPQDVTKMNAAIKANADAIAQEVSDREAADTAMDAAYKAADSALEAAYKAADSALETAYKAADDTLKSELNGEIAKKVDQTAYDSKMTALDGKDADFESRIAALENDESDSQAVQAEALARAAQDDKIEAAVGLSADGAYVTRTGSNYLSGSTSIAEEIGKLDVQAKANADAIALEKERAMAAEAQTLVDAKAYADEKVAAEKGLREAADAALEAAYKAADSGLQGQIDEINTELEGINTILSTDYVTEAEWEARFISNEEIIALFAPAAEA